MNKAREAQEQAIVENQKCGSEHKGFLSNERGLLPLRNPLTSSPPTHTAWDEIAANLPFHYRELSLRRAADALPILPADADALPDLYLNRAASLLSILAHAYVRVQSAPPISIPDAIMRPWETVSVRLGRPAALLTYIDLIMYNWRLRDEEQPVIVENLDLLFPTVGNAAERIFYLTQLEMAAVFTPAVSAIIRAQEAAMLGDAAALERELVIIIDVLQHIAEVSFQKIDVMPLSATYVDPVLWGKTVAPFAVPIREGVPGPSGTSTPITHVMDAFLCRSKHETALGTEAKHLANVFPQHWQQFIHAVGQFSVREEINRSGSNQLKGLFDAVLESFAGDKGFLGAHRRKTFGILELAFKVGRITTVGSFSGRFEDRMWYRVDHELGAARDERYVGMPSQVYTAEVSPNINFDTHDDVTLTSLKVTGQGLRYRAGDRCGILPENSPELVAKTLKALNATADVPVQLTPEWKQAVAIRPGWEKMSVLPLGQLLAFAKLRPVLRTTAKKLLALTASSALRGIVNLRTEDQWELWDFLELLRDGGFDPRILWRTEPWDKEHFCQIVPPESFRLYSISSAPEKHPEDLSLTVGSLVYHSLNDAPYSYDHEREGTASNFLKRCVRTDLRKRTNVKIIPATRFHLPNDSQSPILMFAAGTGIAPFLGFLQTRAAKLSGGENWLFYGTRTPKTILYADELREYAAQGRLTLHIAFSAKGGTGRYSRESGALVFEPGEKQYATDLTHKPDCADAIWKMMCPVMDAGKGAHIYVCGSAQFGVSVRRALETIIDSHIADREAARKFFNQMVADRRYSEDIFTTYRQPNREIRNQIDITELVRHNEPKAGYWTAINGRVYDLSDFLCRHPGGHKILISNAGLDSSTAYKAVMHDVNPEVDSLLGMYEIGVMRRLNFRSVTGVTISPDGLVVVSVEDQFRAWVRYLYLVTEIENALHNDYSLHDQPLTEGEVDGELTPMRIHLMIEAHGRFARSVIRALTGQDLQSLWLTSSGLFGTEEHILWMEHQINGLGQEYQILQSSPDLLWDFLERAKDATPFENKSAQLSALMRLCEQIAGNDAAFVLECKEAARSAVRAFEMHEAAVLSRGVEEVMSALKQIPNALRRYYETMYQLLPQSPQDVINRYSEPDDRTAIPGHGGRVSYRPRFSVGNQSVRRETL